MNTGQATQAASGNRITFTTNQALPNGTINIGGGHSGPVSTLISASQLPNTTTIKTITAGGGGIAGQQHHASLAQHHQQQQQQQQQQHHHHQQQQQSVGGPQTQTLVLKSNHAVSLPAGLVSSAPGIVTMTKAITQGGQQLLNSMIPANVVVGMRPPNAGLQQQKNMAGRVVIGGPHMVSTRPQNPGITFSSLNPGQAPALILKTETGFQLVRVGTATSSPVTQTIGNNSTNPTQIRLQTVPAASIAASSTNNLVNSVANTNSAPTQRIVYTSQEQQQQQQHLQNHPQSQLHTQTQHLHTQPQITQIQTIPPQSHQQQQQQQQHLPTSINNSSSGQTTTTPTTTTTTSAQGNTKEKCRKFLANLIDLSTREPKPVEKNVRNLIQELVNANVEPEEFCDRLERLLNASPQPCLIGFLKKSLPLLRHALFTKELVIEGIKPPPQHVVGLSPIHHQLPKIQAQIRPISQSQTTTIGQTQVRMISPAGAGVPRPIGHTTITKQPPVGVRLQGPANGPRLVNATQIRGPLQPSLPHQQSLPTAPTNIVQLRGPAAVAAAAAQANRPGTVQIRATKPKGIAPTGPTGVTHVKVGQTQIKPLSTAGGTTTLSNHSGAAQSSSISSSSSIQSTINSVASYSINSHHGPALPTPSLPTVQLPPHMMNASAAAVVENNNKINLIHALANKTIGIKAQPTALSKTAAKKKKDLFDKDDKSSLAGGLSASALTTAAANSSFFQQQSSISMSSTLYGDDDINDVAAMGGVNLAEESQRILGSTENIGTQIRSCKDEVFLHLPALQARIRAMVSDRGLEEPSQDVAVLISHACQERLKTIVEKLAVIAEHRIDVIKLNPQYEITKDVRSQIKFLEELDKAEQKRHEEQEREMLLRAAKSRTKVEDPEQAKMKARAKEMQRAEMEELRQRDANMTALQAIGPRKKLKLDSEAAGAGPGSNASSALGGTATGHSAAPLRPRIKRVNLRDMLFYMEQERETCRSEMLYKSYLK